MIRIYPNWARWATDEGVLPFRERVRLLSDAFARVASSDTVEAFFGKVHHVVVGGVSHYAPSTLVVRGAELTERDSDTLRITRVDPARMYTEATGTITAETDDHPLCSLEISQHQGLHLIHVWLSGSDHADPTHVSHHEALFAVARDGDGVHLLNAGAALDGSRLDSADLDYAIAYAALDGDLVLIKAYWTGEFGDVTQIDVACAARIATRPGDNTMTQDTLILEQIRTLLAGQSANTAVASSALEASHVLAAAEATVYQASSRLDATAPTATYYVQLLNSATLPADGAVTHLMAPIKVQHVLGVDDFVDFEIPDGGIAASAGAVLVLSSTEFTKTISGAYLSIEGVVS